MDGRWQAAGRLEDHWRDAVLTREAAFWSAVTVDLERPELGPSLHPHRRLGYRIKLPLDGLDAPLWVIGLNRPYPGDGLSNQPSHSLSSASRA